MVTLRSGRRWMRVAPPLRSSTMANPTTEKRPFLARPTTPDMNQLRMHQARSSELILSAIQNDSCPEWLGPFLFSTPLARLAPRQLLSQKDRVASPRCSRHTSHHRGASSNLSLAPEPQR